MFEHFGDRKKLLSELSVDPAFLERVIDVFAERRTAGFELIYKTI